MRRVRVEWKVQELQKLQDRDSKRHTGSIAIKSQMPNGDISAAASMVNHYHLPPVQNWTINEIVFKTEVELILLNSMSTVQLPATRSVGFPPPSHISLIGLPRDEEMRWPSVLLHQGILPKANICIRVPQRELDWDPQLAPVLFAAVSSPKEARNLQKATELAYVFHPMMILFIIFYLDTRQSPGEPIPPWMCLFGLVYTEEGFVVHAHFPVFHWDDADSDRLCSPHRWGARSIIITRTCLSAFTQSHGRSQSLALLLRVQSHARWVLEELKKWDGYEPAFRALL